MLVVRRHTPARPSASGGIARLAYTRAKGAGLAVDLMVRKARLRLREMDDPSRQLRVRDQIEFLNLAARRYRTSFSGLI